MNFHLRIKMSTFARLITYFDNFVYGFLSLWLRDFLYDVFRLQGKMGKTKWKINKLLRNILVTSLPKTTKNEVTKMGWNAHSNENYFYFLVTIITKKDGLDRKINDINHRVKRQFTNFNGKKIINIRQSPNFITKQTNLPDGQKTERNLIAYSSSSLFLLDLVAM